MRAPDAIAPSAVVERSIAIHDGEIAYRERPGDGPVVVLLHALSGRAAAWDEVLALLPQGLRAIAPDLRGRGRTRRTGGGGFAAHRDDLGRLLARLGVTRTLLAGHSFGALVAVDAACAWQDGGGVAVDGVVLVDGGTRPPREALAAADEAGARFEATWPDPDAYLAVLRDSFAWRDAWSAETAALLAGDLRADGRAWRVRGEAAVVRDDVAAMRALPGLVDPRLRCRATVVRAGLGVRGGDDVVLGEPELRALRERWGARVVTLPDARHGSIVRTHAASIAEACAAAVGFAAAGTDNDRSADASS